MLADGALGDPEFLGGAAETLKADYRLKRPKGGKWQRPNHITQINVLGYEKQIAAIATVAVT
jgi:hypothetical protein